MDQEGFTNILHLLCNAVSSSQIHEEWLRERPWGSICGKVYKDNDARRSFKCVDIYRIDLIILLDGVCIYSFKFVKSEYMYI